MSADPQVPVTEGDLLTMNEAAAYLKTSTTTLRRWVRNKKVRHVRMGGVLRFWRGDLDAFLAGQTVPVEDTPVSKARAAAGAPSQRSQAARRGRAA
jgi:excisionase family DNA binding protein